MSDITKDLEQILQARYGKDVRQSIHDGIKDCHDDANMYAQETAAALAQVGGAVQAAEQATSEAQAAASNANQASSEANEAAQSANSAAEEAREAAGQISDKLSRDDIVSGEHITITENQEGKLEISSTSETNIATSEQAGIVKASEDVTVSEDGTMSVNTEFIMDKIYPIGSIYMSVNALNPSSLFGGTWEAWGSGRVPVGVNVSETEFATVEKTGGEKIHTLTVEELASHTHAFTGSLVTSGKQSVNHTHSIPALRGTAASGGSEHNHILAGRSNGFGDNSMINGVAATNAIWNSEEGQITRASGAHTHSVTTTASTTGNQSTSHTHSVTAKGTNSNTGSGKAHNNLQPYITCYMWKRIA